MSEPITIADVENQLRTDDLSEESVLIEGIFIPAIREKAEGITRRALVTQTETLSFNYFPSIISLIKPPLVSVESIKYINTEGVETTLDPLLYRVIKDKNNPEQPSFIIPAYGFNWPSVRDDFAVVEVNYTCGYTPENCPKAIKQWMLLNVGALYENREAVITSGKGGVVLDLSKTLADSLLDKYRIARL